MRRDIDFPSVRLTKVREDRITSMLDGATLRRLILDRVASEAGLLKMPIDMTRGARGGETPVVTGTVKFEDETEGSPSYSVGKRAVVEIVVVYPAEGEK